MVTPTVLVIMVLSGLIFGAGVKNKGGRNICILSSCTYVILGPESRMDLERVEIGRKTIDAEIEEDKP
jgi:hypothetical protein